MPEFDVIVVGGGVGGLVAAGLAQRLGLSVLLLESHASVGGCAGYFERGPFAFDAGATALMGIEPGEPLGDVFAMLGLELKSTQAGYRVHLPDQSFDLPTDASRFEHDVIPRLVQARSNQQRARLFWRLQEQVGRTLFECAGAIPRLPLGSASDVMTNLAALGLGGSLAAATAAVTVQNVLGALGLGEETKLAALLAMLLEDTAQAGPDVVPFANASACLHAYRRGMRRPRGGMKAFVEALADGFHAAGGAIRLADPVSRVRAIARGPGEAERSFAVHTRRGGIYQGRQVVFNLPLDLAAKLLDRPLTHGLGSSERRSRATWGAFTGYLAIDRAAVPDDTPLFHHVLRSYAPPLHDGNNVLISLSPLEDRGYGPPGVRVATLSTHTFPHEWQGLDAAGYRERKNAFAERMLSALGQALPEAPGAIVHAEFGTPRTFARYTRRRAGAVGGPPATRWNTNAFAVGPNVLGPGIFVTGDSVFPGQGTMAVAISAIRVVEQLVGVRWGDLRKAPPAVLATARAHAPALTPAHESGLAATGQKP